VDICDISHVLTIGFRTNQTHSIPPTDKH